VDSGLTTQLDTTQLDATQLDAMLSGVADRVAAEKHKYTAQRPQSAALHERARRVLPGGNTRSVLHFEPFPFRVVAGEGVHLVDADGHRYVDFCGNYTASLLGHRPEPIKAAIEEVLSTGWAIGSTQEREIELAELICERFPSMDLVRFTNSGTEANLMAITSALHHTGRKMVGVFDHGYHGGVLSFGDFGGPHHPLNAPFPFVVGEFNNIDGLDAMFEQPLGCVLVEAVQGSGGCRPASPEFLSELRRRCTEHDVVMIMDEVMTSRLGPSGAQGRFGITPDMTTLGKYIAGGLSFGAFGGSAAVMNAFDPSQGGALTQAGTFNNNAMSMAAGIATLRTALDPAKLERTNQLGDDLRFALTDALGPLAGHMWVTGLGSMLCAHASHPKLLELYFLAMLDEGHFLARRGFMALSLEIDQTHVDSLVSSTEQWAAALVA
jgi:glutamate-1-semialdehyde 2,1-aminomutase